MKLSSRYNVPKIKASTVEQAAYAFALRECYIYMEDGINECAEVLGEIAGITELPWERILKRSVYAAFFSDRADIIIPAIKKDFEAGIIDLRVLGYEHKTGKDYDRYVDEFADSSLYELVEKGENKNEG